MDQLHDCSSLHVFNGMNIPCKVSVVNAEGHVVLDTLIKPSVNGEDIADIAQYPGFRSLQHIHGIKPRWLEDAPSFASVREHIMELAGKEVELSDDHSQTEGSPFKDKTSSLNCTESNNENKEHASPEKGQLKNFVPVYPDTFNHDVHAIFIGHGVTLDLKVMRIADVPYYCTQQIDKDPVLHQSKKLKDLCKKHLNATIQEGHHSSIIDSRASLALFLKLGGLYGLEAEGPLFASETDQFTAGRRRRRKNYTQNQLFHKQAFKSLDSKPATERAACDQSQYDALNMAEVEKQLAKLILEACPGKLEPDRRYKFNKNDLIRQIDGIVRSEFRKLMLQSA